MSNPYAQAQATMLEIVAFGLDYLTDRGITITDEQYREAIVTAGEAMTTSGAAPKRPEVVNAAIECLQMLSED